MAAIAFEITRDGPAQTKGTTWFAAEAGKPKTKFTIGQTVSFKDGDGAHRGLYQTAILPQIPKLYFDRNAAASTLGLWAHFIWPTVTVESAGGHHLLINTYDRARCTFGFYQLAAHTPNDNLILLFRALLALPKAVDYFPDLQLKNGKVHRNEGGTSHSLEVVTNVHRPNGKFEDQIVGFMSYLNPDTTTAGSAEAETAAKLMHWLLNDPAAIEASVAVAISIVKRKVRAQASIYKLEGKDPRLAIWVSDISHQGRGTKSAITAALAETTIARQLAALQAIDVVDNDGNPLNTPRRNGVKKCVDKLQTDKVFDGVLLGDKKLPLKD
jgi:hypothetical protein